VEPLQENKNHFFISQLIADNKEARRDVIQSFLNKYPSAIISGYDRKGRRITVKDSAKLLKRILKYGF
jgi:predicted transcriptional regulator